MKRSSKLISLLLVLVMILAACGGGDKPAEEPAKGTETEAPETENKDAENASGEAKTDIVFATAVDFITMDPLDANDTLSGSLQRTMMEGLFGFDKDMKVIPLLAESYEANENATEFTFKLREGVKFTDGTDFNADAAIANLNRMSDQSLGLKRNSLFKMIEKSEKIDDYNIKVYLNQPFGAFINTLAHPAGLMVSPKALEEYGKDVANHPIGTGRYIFDSWTPGEKLIIKANPDYWQGAPEFTSVTFKPITENGTRVSMLQTGDADFINPVPSEQVEALKNDPNLTIEVKPSIITRCITLNTAKKPFDDVRVRQALNYAIDKDAYAKVVYNGLGIPADSLLGPNVQFYSAQTPYEYNIEKAKELLKEAGYPDGFETTLWSGNTTTNIKATQFIKQQLEAVGVKVNVENMETGTLEEKVTGYAKGTPGNEVGVEMYAIGWSPSTGDADWMIRPLLASESVPPVSYNISYYENPELDGYVQEALETAEPAKREEAYAKAQKLLWEEAPMIFLTVDQSASGYRNTISGITILPDGSFSLAEGKIVK